MRSELERRHAARRRASDTPLRDLCRPRTTAPETLPPSDQSTRPFQVAQKSPAFAQTSPVAPDITVVIRTKKQNHGQEESCLVSRCKKLAQTAHLGRRGALGHRPLVREIQEKLLQKLAQRNLLSHLAIAVQETRFPQLATLQQKERSTKRTLL
jgi:hypothetical protein